MSPLFNPSGGGSSMALVFSAMGKGSTVDATTTYHGLYSPDPAVTQSDQRRIYCPVACTVTKVYGLTSCTGTAPSNEASTVSFRKNNTTDTTITSSLDMSGVTSSAPVAFSNTGLSISMAAGDYFEIKWLTPTWATNPTGNVDLTATIYATVP